MIMELPAALESDLQRTTGLTTFEYLVSANLAEADERKLRVSELASSANSSLSRLSHVVGRLAGNGLVVKRVCAEDGRVSVVELTKAGLRRVSAAAPLHVAKVRELVVEPLTKADLIRLVQSGTGHYQPDRRVGLAHRLPPVSPPIDGAFEGWHDARSEQIRILDFLSSGRGRG